MSEGPLIRTLILVVVASHNGNVYALWLDGSIANVWSCSQDSSNEHVESTPVICSLDGSNVSMIVASTENIYKIDLYSGTFDPVNNPTRWPWPTFHHDNARTGCATTPSTNMVSSSIVGRVKSSTGVWLKEASVQVQWYNTATSSWVTNTPVFGRPNESRENPILTVGNATNGDEINEGGFVINQLTPDRRYQLVVSKSGYTTQTVPVNSDQAIPTGRTPVADITLQP